MAPSHHKPSFLVQFGGGALVLLIIANIIVRLLGYGSSGGAAPPPSTPAAPGDAAAATAAPAAPSGTGTSPALPNPVADFIASVKLAKNVFDTLPAVQGISKKAEVFSEPKRNPFRWDLLEAMPGIASSGMQIASGPQLPDMLPRFLGAFTVGGQLKCLIGIGNRAYLLASDTEFFGLPFRISMINQNSLTIAFANGYHTVIDRGMNPTDPVSMAAKALKERRTWDFPLAAPPQAQSVSPATPMKTRESPR